LNSFWQNLGSKVKRPLQLCVTSPGKYVMLLVSGVAFPLSITFVFMVLKREPSFLNPLLILDGLVAALSGMIFFLALANVLLGCFRHNPPKELVPPFKLKGASKGNFGQFLVSELGILFCFYFATSVCEFDWNIRSSRLAGAVMLILFLAAQAALILFSILAGKSCLQVTKEGLQVLGSPHARRIGWSEIRRFRLKPTPLMLRIDGKEEKETFRRKEVSGHVKVVLEKGEFTLPERYGMDPCDLRDLLNRARGLCVPGSASPEGPEPFGSPGALTPVVQNEDLDSLRISAEHLAAQGFSGSIVPLTQLKESERKNWLSPARGGYVLCLSVEQDIQKAMQVLAEHLKEHEEAVEQKEGSPC